MHIQIERKLTHIFGMTRRRDAMLGDLLYSIRTEGLSAHAEMLCLRLASCHNRSAEVAKCLAAVVDYIELTDRAGTAHNMAVRMATAAGSGPVLMLLAAKIPPLEKLAQLEIPARQQAARIIDRVRLGARDPDSDGGILRTLFCYNQLGPRRRKPHVDMKPTPPHVFVWELEH